MKQWGAFSPTQQPVEGAFHLDTRKRGAGSKIINSALMHFKTQALYTIVGYLRRGIKKLKSLWSYSLSNIKQIEYHQMENMAAFKKYLDLKRPT